MNNKISIVIGSWGSYNECNDKALGSKWLNLSNFDSWEDIEEELKKEGFDLNGIDEELFIQDIEGLNCSNNWDNKNPKVLFELIKDSDVLNNDYKYKVMQAYLEVRSLSEWKNLVESNGSRWDDEIHLYENYDWSDYGKEMFDCCGYEIPDIIEQFIDFEAYGKYVGDCNCEECNDGIIEID